MPTLRHRKKDRLMEKAGSLLGPVVKRLGIESGVRLSQIKKDWHTLFEKPLSLHMYPSRLTEGELLLNVDSPIWIQQLNFFRKDILTKLSRYGVREIRFRIGKISLVKVCEEPRPKPSELSSEDASFIECLVDHISDVELKCGARSSKKIAENKKMNGSGPSDRSLLWTNFLFIL